MFRHFPSEALKLILGPHVFKHTPLRHETWWERSVVCSNLGSAVQSVTRRSSPSIHHPLMESIVGNWQATAGGSVDYPGFLHDGNCPKHFCLLGRLVSGLGWGFFPWVFILRPYLGLSPWTYQSLGCCRFVSIAPSRPIRVYRCAGNSIGQSAMASAGICLVESDRPASFGRQSCSASRRHRVHLEAEEKRDLELRSRLDPGLADNQVESTWVWSYDDVSILFLEPMRATC